MHLLLLSGGSGKRLWPLSNGVRTKQFLKVLRRDDGQMESMVQRVCRQLPGTKGINWKSVTVVAGMAQQDQLHLQLPEDINVILEPSRRDTFPAIVYALSQLVNNGTIGINDTLAIMPVDPYVDPDFFDHIALIETELQQTSANLVLIGNKPIIPTEKFGYILVGEADEESQISHKVEGFKEKPTTSEAEQLIAQGALWNCGIFGMKASYLLNIMQSRYGIDNYDPISMRDSFEALKQISFDYEVVEKEPSIRVIEYTGEWKDLGTWETLTEEMKRFSTGKVFFDDNNQDTHVINELDIPVVVIGSEDNVVVATSDGILVAKKTETYRLKSILSSHDDRIMYEKRRWGEYQVLNRCATGDSETLVKKLLLWQGKQFSYQYHEHRKEIWIITSGEGILNLEGEKREVRVGDTITIEIGQKHGLLATTELELIEIQMGTPLIEEDIVRLEMNW